MLSVYPPVEILSDRSKTFPGLSHIIEKVCGSCARNFTFLNAKKTLKMFSEKDYFDSKGKAAMEAWPQGLVEHLDEGKGTMSQHFFPVHTLTNV